MKRFLPGVLLVLGLVTVTILMYAVWWIVEALRALMAYG